MVTLKEALGSSLFGETPRQSRCQENTTYLNSLLKGEDVHMVNTKRHTSLLFVYLSVKDTHINNHRALSSCASVAVFLLAGCLCFAPWQHRGGDALCNLWRVPGMGREREREV